MQSILSEIKNHYKHGNYFTKLLYFNLLFYLVYKVFTVFEYLFQSKFIDSFIENYLFLPSNTELILKKPWTLLSYMFVHVDFGHILFNLILLYFGSKLFLRQFNGKQLISTYILGGICGAIFFIVSYNLFPVFANDVINAKAFGASASVLAIVIAIATYTPNILVPILFFGHVKLTYIALGFIMLAFFSIPVSNPGGHIAHLGGIVYGFLYVLLIKKGYDLSINFYNILDSFSFLFRKKKRSKTSQKRSEKNNDYAFKGDQAKQQQKINHILEKISKSGYDSLTKKEKELLFQESKK